MFNTKALLLTALAATLATCKSLSHLQGKALESSALLSLSWELGPTNTNASFRGLGPVSEKVAWVAGSAATVLRTIDGGATWASVGPSLEEADAGLEFRDVQAFSANKAIVLSIGEGTDSRIYSTSDGGKSWSLVFQNDEPTAFYNCMDFQSKTRGMAVSDPVDGKFRLVETTDGGETWKIVDSSGMPEAWPGEYQFSASGTCLSTSSGRWYIASGGVDPGRVWSSDDGHNWTARNASIPGNPSAGVFSVQFRSKKHGIALGGDFENPTGSEHNAALSWDGGWTWKSAKRFPSGYRSGSTFLPVLPNVAFAVGPTGSDWSLDGGITWHGFDNGSFHAVECVKPWACWASGESGRVARLTL